MRIGLVHKVSFLHPKFIGLFASDSEVGRRSGAYRDVLS